MKEANFIVSAFCYELPRAIMQNRYFTKDGARALTYKQRDRLVTRVSRLLALGEGSQGGTGRDESDYFENLVLGAVLADNNPRRELFNINRLNLRMFVNIRDGVFSEKKNKRNKPLPPYRQFIYFDFLANTEVELKNGLKELGLPDVEFYKK